jgi:Glycosyl transferases group 1
LKIACIGHSHHRKTGSSNFFLGLLKELAAVDVYWDEGWLGKDNLDFREILSRGYDVTVLYQTERHAKFLSDSGRRVVFVPMYDSCLPFSESFWRELTHIEILCFCRTLFEQLQGWGLHAKYAQFFPDPAHFKVNTEQEYAGFFWRRRHEPRWETLRSLVGDSELSWINVHEAPDLDSPPPAAISESDQKRYRLRFSAWSEDRTTYVEALRQAGIYFAPRLHEGIGMSFLEAMAMGKAIVAANNPTMNEYLTHNVNGYLFDPEDPRPITLTRFREMGRMARQTIERGHLRWRRSREEISAWLLSGAWPRRRPFVVQQMRDPAQISVISIPSSDREDLEQTCLSVGAQNCSNVEHIIVSRSPQVSSVDSSVRYVSVPDTASRSEILNAAAAQARAEWIIFLNEGDTLLDENVLSEALEGQSADVDFIIGHYVESRGDGEHMHWVSDFDDTWKRLRAGKLDPTWFARLPTLAATLINRNILQEHGFSRRFQHAADLDFFLRCKRDSTRFRHANTTTTKIAVKSRGQLLGRIAESRSILSRETDDLQPVNALFESLRAAECEPLLRGWSELGPRKLCATLMRDREMARYAVSRAWRRLCFLGARGVLLRLSLRLNLTIRR